MLFQHLHRETEFRQLTCQNLQIDYDQDLGDQSRIIYMEIIIKKPILNL